MSLHFAMEFDSIEQLLNRTGNPIVIQKKTNPIDPADDLDARIIKAFGPVNPKKIILFGSDARLEYPPSSRHPGLHAGGIRSPIEGKRFRKRSGRKGARYL
jgi:hypothetical protein